MPNEIGLVQKFSTKKTDDVYKAKSLSSVFNKKQAKKPFKKKKKTK